MSDLQLFTFDQSKEIRFVGDFETPECVGIDIVAILNPEIEIKQRATYLRAIPSQWRSSKKVKTSKGYQQLVTLLEPGIYFLIARSNSDKAIPFQKWLFEEVIPSIRKTGQYSLEKTKKQLIASQDKVKRLQGKISQDAPKVLFAEESGDFEEGSLRIAEFAKTLGIGSKKLWKIFRRLNIFRQHSKYPAPFFVKQGYFQVFERRDTNGKTFLCLVTPKGQIELTKLIKDSKLLNGVKISNGGT